MICGHRELNTILGPNNEPLNNELCSLFRPFYENMKITNLRKVRYLDQSQLKTDRNLVENNPEFVKNSQNKSLTLKINAKITRN